MLVFHKFVGLPLQRKLIIEYLPALITVYRFQYVGIAGCLRNNIVKLVIKCHALSKIPTGVLSLLLHIATKPFHLLIRNISGCKKGCLGLNNQTILAQFKIIPDLKRTYLKSGAVFLQIIFPF